MRLYVGCLKIWLFVHHEPILLFDVFVWTEDACIFLSSALGGDPIKIVMENKYKLWLKVGIWDAAVAADSV